MVDTFENILEPSSNNIPQDIMSFEDILSQKDSAQILREELKFSRFLIRIQKKLALGIKEMFVTHLKMKELWEEFELKENSFIVKLNEPSSFYTLRELDSKSIVFP